MRGEVWLGSMTNSNQDSSLPATGGLRPDSDWTRALGLLLVALALLVSLFFETGRSIVSIWERSDTFAHGFLIVPISLWLVWEKRAGLRHLTPAPTIWPLLLLIPLGAGWLLGNLVDALVVQQFAFVGMLMATIWATLGNRVARWLAFPILFLAFGVPVGEGLIYPLMNFTADFTVGMLKLTGIPVYREGTFFTIPTGKWSVVEACSGLRYLIASVTLGVLYAYLTYTRWWKRLLFVLFAIGVPILANGLRAYMIVMIGHLSDMSLAVGVDHLIYGWVFFGIIITIMFLIGAIWRDPQQAPPSPSPTGQRLVTRADHLRMLAALSLLAGMWPLASVALADRTGPVAAIDLAVPTPEGGWSLLGADVVEGSWDWRPHVVGADGSIYGFFGRAETTGRPPIGPVGLYLGVYRTQRQGAELVSTGNYMVHQKDSSWSDLAIVPRKVKIAGRGFRVEEHMLLSRQGQRLLVWTWYRVGDRHTANPYIAKLTEALSRLSGRRGEAALIAVAAPYRDQPAQAEALLLDFMNSMLPSINRRIEQAVAP